MIVERPSDRIWLAAFNSPRLGRSLSRGAATRFGEPSEYRQSMVSARRVADRDDHDREPAVRVDSIRRTDAIGDRLATFGHPSRVRAIRVVPDLGTAVRRLARRSARPTLVHHGLWGALRSWLGRLR